MELSLDKIIHFKAVSVNDYANKVKQNNLIKSLKNDLKGNELKNPSFNSLAISKLESKSLTILQDFDTGKTVYRQIDNKTNLILTQYPRESELARIAFLKKIEEVALKKLNKDKK